MFHEWLEAVLRMAYVLYRKRHEDRLADALDHLCRTMATRLPRLALVDADAFRWARLYTGAVEAACLPRMAELRAVYDTFSSWMVGKRKRLGVKVINTPVFAMDNWNALLVEAGLLDGEADLGRSDYKLLFLWARLLVVDEYDRAKEGLLPFVTFLELIARTADAYRARALAGENAFPLEAAVGDFVDALLRRLAIAGRGHLRVHAPGSHLDGRIVADLRQFLPEGFDPAAEVSQREPGRRKTALPKTPPKSASGKKRKGSGKKRPATAPE
mmetsp:Transcript_29332/g.98817  ORF Transcript_29332/g.98817 Transcript_29332/m.98817 type:complete len:271 (+) Transcript_29332:318-1130(+)